MNEFPTEYEELKRADVLRKRKRLAQRKKRQKQIRIYKILTATIIIIAVISGIMVKIFFWPERNSNITEKETENIAIDVNGSLNDEIEMPITQKKPEIDDEFVEITDENIDSEYIALLDVKNNKVIAGRECDEKIYPASMTKVMTLIVAAEHLKDMEATYTYSFPLLNQLYIEGASVAGFLADEEVSIKDMLYALILPSGADAAVGLAELTAGSEEAFANLMNEKCKELGLEKTHFTNASGLHDEEQYTTPLEMAAIMSYAMNSPEMAQFLSTYKYTIQPTNKHPEGITLTSTMFGRMKGKEVENVSIIAGKTGYTEDAGNCLVTYALKDQNPYIVVLAKSSYKYNTISDDLEIYKSYLP